MRFVRAAVCMTVVVGLGGCSSESAGDSPRSFRLTQVPSGWCTSEATLSGDPTERKRSVTLLDTTRPESPANVIASSEPLGAPHDETRTYAKNQGQLLDKEFGSYEQLESGASKAYDGDGFERVFTWTPDDGRPVWQMQAYYAKDRVGYTVTATTAEDENDRVRDQLRSVVEGVRLVDERTEKLPARCD